jgi:predicted kinase
MVSPQVIADARRLAEGLEHLSIPEAKTAIVVVSGLPGTGKSSFSRRLASRLPFVILESDALRKTLFPEPTYSAAESARLFQTIHYLIEYMLKKGVPIILDATNLSEHHRERIYSIAERTGARLILVRVEAPPEVVQERLKTRTGSRKTGESSDADWAVYEKLRTTVEKIRRHHYVVDTSRDIEPILEKIVREVKR